MASSSLRPARHQPGPSRAQAKVRRAPISSPTITRHLRAGSWRLPGEALADRRSGERPVRRHDVDVTPGEPPGEGGVAVDGPDEQLHPPPRAPAPQERGGKEEVGRSSARAALLEIREGHELVGPHPGELARAEA